MEMSLIASEPARSMGEKTMSTIKVAPALLCRSLKNSFVENEDSK